MQEFHGQGRSKRGDKVSGLMIRMCVQDFEGDIGDSHVCAGL